ncbi:MAG: HEAT repeat domain-containing protein [Candidatus Wallbacteria bacterium]|nr:HEAT repeat domain-containing protein [Candidatus Wallbacteria bacterium]
MRSGKRILLVCMLALAPCAVAAEENPFHLKDTREAFEHPSVPQEVPDGLTVKFRLGKGGPLVESKNLNGRFDRVEETAKLLDKEGYPLERQAAVQELARYPGEPTVYALIPALRDINPFVRERAAAALGEMGDVRAIRPLIDMLGYSDHGRAEVAARALEKITGVQNLGASLEAWETWWEAYRKWPHGIGTPKKSGP